VAHSLFEASDSLKLFSPDRIRSHGAWKESDKYVFHDGEMVHSKAGSVSCFDASDYYIYAKDEKIPFGKTPLSIDDGLLLIETINGARWGRPIYGQILSGWIALAPICGLFDFRPHIWISGPRGSGKTTIFEDIIAHCLKGLAFQAQGSTSEAGLRQKLHGSPVPVVFDEAEDTGGGEDSRSRKLVEFARLSFKESDAPVYKGSASGKAVKFEVKSMFAIGSITPKLEFPADINRFIVMDLKPSGDDVGDSKLWKEAYRKFTTSSGHKGFSERLLVRSFSLVDKIKKSVEAIYPFAIDQIKDQRRAHIYSHVFAGFWSLYNDDVIHEESIHFLLNQVSEMELNADKHETDAESALSTIQSHRIRTGTSVSPSGEATISSLIDKALLNGPGDLSMAALAKTILLDHGIHVLADKISFQKKHRGIQEALKGSFYSVGYDKILESLPGADGNGVQKFYSLPKRVVSIPIEYFVKK